MPSIYQSTAKNQQQHIAQMYTKQTKTRGKIKDKIYYD